MNVALHQLGFVIVMTVTHISYVSKTSVICAYSSRSSFETYLRDFFENSWIPSALFWASFGDSFEIFSKDSSGKYFKDCLGNRFFENSSWDSFGIPLSIPSRILSGTHNLKIPPETLSSISPKIPSAVSPRFHSKLSLRIFSVIYPKIRLGIPSEILPKVSTQILSGILLGTPPEIP